MKATTIDVKTTTRTEMVDVSSLIRTAIRESGVKSGIACVFCPHTTAAIALQEKTNPAVKRDTLAMLSTLVPQDSAFEHNEDNSDAHVKSALVGASSSLVIEGGRPVLGSWQAVFLCEFDGPRNRRIIVKCVPDGA